MPCICGGEDEVVAPQRQVKQSVAEGGPASRGTSSMVAANTLRKRQQTPYPENDVEDHDQDDGPPERIVNPPPRTAIDTENMEVHMGPFVDERDADFEGKVMYEPCRNPVYVPHDWNPKVAGRSARLPDADLQLEFVYGYAGKANTSKNVYYNSDGKVVYYTAGLGIVYDHPPAHTQEYFHGHNDDICALTVCPCDVDFGGTSYPAKAIAASGQLSHVEEGAYVSIWDSTAPEAKHAELQRLDFGKEARGFCALGFSPNGDYLTVVTMDDNNSVHVFDWRSGVDLCEADGLKGQPPAVNGVEWNPYEAAPGVAGSFVTFGRRHLRKWTSADGRTWSSKNLSFGSLLMQNILSAQWLPPRANGTQFIVAGCDNGQLYLIDADKVKVIKAIDAHAPGPKSVQPNGSLAHIGVRGLCARQDADGSAVLLSGGADGKVLSWDCSDGTIKDGRFAADTVQLTSPFASAKKKPPAIRALDYSMEMDRILIGTNNCDVVEVADGEIEILMDGHAGDIWGVATHPANPSVFASVADSGHLHLVDADEHKMIDVLALNWKPRAVTFSNEPIDGSYHIAVGGAQGMVRILDEDNLEILKEIKDSKQGISDIKYSPDNTMMAVATYDAWIDIYSVTNGYKKIARCTGHSATVRGIDWNDDSTTLMSNSNDYEMLYWDARTGAQIINPKLFGYVHYYTYTCMLGFPVMGIWHPEADGTDVNSLNRSHNEQLLVTSDDHGRVKLFNYPCVIDDAPAKVYTGHSSHVMCVRFNCDDSLVCSGGGHDKSVFQYRVRA